jgi:hydrogenase maturation protease
VAATNGENPSARVLVAGLGEPTGDGAFGRALVARLGAEPLAPGARAEDFVARAPELALALAAGLDGAVLVEAHPRGGAPGTLYVLEPHPTPDVVEPRPPLTLAALAPVELLRLAARLGAPPRRVVLVGCEPEPGRRRGLSPRVEAALDDAALLVTALVTALLEGQPLPLAEETA